MLRVSERRKGAAMRIRNALLNFGGFVGLRYFATGNPGDLFYFSFFAFFSFFVLGRINYEYPDERWRENSRRASAVAFRVAACAVLLTGFVAANSLGGGEGVVLAAAFGWTASLFAYAIAFRIYEAS